MSMGGAFCADRFGVFTQESKSQLKKRSLFLFLIILVSWGLEYLWVRYDLLLDFRPAGIHYILLFLLPLGSVWFLFSEGVNLIGMCGRFGQTRWWFLTFLLPIVFAGVTAFIMAELTLVSLPDNANIGTRTLGLIVDIPLNYVLWFPVLFSTEFFWRGAFQLQNENRLRSTGHSVVSSFLWALSLAGFLWVGHSENGFSLLPGLFSVVSLIWIGMYQSMIFRRSGSILVSVFSLLCVVLVNSFIFEIPLAGIRPLLEALRPHSIASAAGFFVSSCLLGLTGIVMQGGGKEDLPLS
jgi:hypothetical protein